MPRAKKRGMPSEHAAHAAAQRGLSVKATRLYTGATVERAKTGNRRTPASSYTLAPPAPARRPSAVKARPAPRPFPVASGPYRAPKTRPLSASKPKSQPSPRAGMGRPSQPNAGKRARATSAARAEVRRLQQELTLARAQDRKEKQQRAAARASSPAGDKAFRKLAGQREQLLDRRANYESMVREERAAANRLVVGRGADSHISDPTAYHRAKLAATRIQDELDKINAQLGKVDAKYHKQVALRARGARG